MADFNQEEIRLLLKNIKIYNRAKVLPVVLRKQHKDTKVVNPDHYIIDITYPEMEAEIFKRAYKNKLDEIENIECYDAEKQNRKDEQLKQIQNEYETFLQFNQ